MILRIINSILILIDVFMGTKQGYAMLSGKQEMLDMFGKWGFNKTFLAINGAATMIAAVMILFPKTFFRGNFLMAAGILLIICFRILDRDLKGVVMALPFLLINLVIVYLEYPFKTEASL